MRILIYLCLLFSFALIAMAIAPFRGFAMDLADDPFFYLHQDAILPFYRPWFASESSSTAKFHRISTYDVSSIAVYDEVTAKIHQRRRILNSRSSIENGALGSGCENILVMVNETSTLSIEANSLQSVSDGQCKYKIENAVFSDDETKLAVQMAHWANEHERYIRVFGISGNTSAPLHSLPGRLRLPAAFAYDGGVLYAPSGSFRSYFNNCVVRKWLNGVDSCEIWRSDLSPSKREMALSMYRGAGGQSSWVLLSNLRRGKGSVYQWDISSKRPGLIATGIDDVSRLAATSTGFFYAKEAEKNAPAEENELQFFYFDSTRISKSILSAPISGTKWTRKGDGLLVWIKGNVKTPNQLLRVSESGVMPLRLSKYLQFVANVEFLHSSPTGEIRLRVEENSGELSYGNVNAAGDFVEDSSLRYPFSIEVNEFLGRSQDGISVPCSIVRKAGLTKPLPAIVEVYGAYGVILRPIVGPVDAAILGKNIAIVYAHSRGGGELGAAWENGGKGVYKINTIHDTEACIGAAIQSGLILDGKILLRGASAGALPAMMVALRNPVRTRGAWLDVPYLDSAGLHHNDSAADAEFGTVGDSREALERLKISPYHTLLTPSGAMGSYLLGCGENDVRVPSWHCMKVHMAIKKFHPNMRSHLFISEERGHVSSKPGAAAGREYDLIALSFVLSTLH
jgi:hypothetical protein